MDYRDNRQRWAESHQVVHFYAGQWCTFTPALTESERGAVLISVSYLEGQLKSIIAAYPRSGKATEKLLDDFNGPLGTFGARSHAAAALELITDREYQELKRLGKIRNHCCPVN